MVNTESKFQQSFNARYMSFEEVAKSFIVSEHFENIIKPEHTILTGSRGCGKTTLLKMLHPKALHSWNTSEGNVIKNKIDFTGIYIPSDRQWGSQLMTFQQKFPNNIEFVHNVFRGVINSNVLIAVCSTFNALIETSDIEPGFEIELGLKLIENWEISTPVSPHLDDITIKIRKMVSDFNAYYRQGIIAETLPSICYKTYIDLVSISVDCFNSLNKQCKYRKIICKDKWALCFDELEIMPDFFQKEIVNYDLRGISDQRLLLKLTSTPGLDKLSIKGNLKPTEIDDYTILKLWIYDTRSQKKWRNYCEKYMKFAFEEYYNRKINLNTLFGKNIDYNKGLRAVEGTVFAKSKSDGDDGENQFSEDGIMWEVMRLLQEYDNSFYHYLVKKGVDPFNPIPKNKNQEAAIHRKIKPIVLYRYYFTEVSKTGKGKKIRSRNVNAFNNGKEYIFDIADGNPRAFAYLVSEFVDKIHFENSTVQEMPIPLQSRTIYSFSKNYFHKKILNYPKNEITVNNHKDLLYEIIDKIGNYFFDKMVMENFNPDPVIFFYINSGETLLNNFIEIALEAGAIFKVEEEIKVKGIKKTRDVYRLSYSLYPIYKLPKVDYNPIPLSRILQDGTKDINVLTLFPDNEIE